jgi:hypothetical protein
MHEFEKGTAIPEFLKIVPSIHNSNDPKKGIIFSPEDRSSLNLTKKIFQHSLFQKKTGSYLFFFS